MKRRAVPRGHSPCNVSPRLNSLFFRPGGGTWGGGRRGNAGAGRPMGTRRNAEKRHKNRQVEGEMR